MKAAMNVTRFNVFKGLPKLASEERTKGLGAGRARIQREQEAERQRPYFTGGKEPEDYQLADALLEKYPNAKNVGELEDQVRQELSPKNRLKTAAGKMQMLPLTPGIVGLAGWALGTGLILGGPAVGVAASLFSLGGGTAVQIYREDRKQVEQAQKGLDYLIAR